MSSTFESAWAKTHASEKGYVNHPDDPGGETNHGITARVARANGYFGPMKDLPIETATAIAKREYWDLLRLDDVAALSEPVALELFDTHFNLWSGAAAKFLQRALNGLNRQGKDYADISVDGQLGPGTIASLRSYLQVRGKDGERVLLRLLNAQQACDYLRQSQETHGKESFLFGWCLHRVVI